MGDPSADLLPREVRRPLFLDGLASRLMDTFTGGPFLAGLGLLVGATNFQLGLLAALPFLAQAAQLPTLALLLRVRDRRATVLWAAGAARVLLGVVAGLLFLAALHDPSLLPSPALLIGILAVNALLVVTATAAWNWWMRDTLPIDRLGAFFGHRLRWTTVAAMGALFAAGGVLDALKGAGGETLGYALLFALGTLCGFGGLVALRLVPHSPPHAAVGEPGRRRRTLLLLREVMARPGTRTALLPLGLVSAALTFAMPFVAVFLLRGMQYAYVAVTGLAVVSQLGYLAGLRGWGFLSDRHGDRSVLFASLALLAVTHAGWFATGWEHTSWADPWALALVAWLAVLHFAMGFALGGAELGGTNLMLKSAPADQAQAHLAAVGLGKAVVAGVGTIAAGLLWDAVGTQAIVGAGSWQLRGFQVLALVALGLTLASMVATLRIREVRDVPVVEVARAMRREVAQMSSIAGIRGFIHALSYSVEFMAGPFEGRRARQGRRGRKGTPPGPAPDPAPAKGP